MSINKKKKSDKMNLTLKYSIIKLMLYLIIYIKTFILL